MIQPVWELVYESIVVFTLPNMPILYPPFSLHGPRVYIDPGNIPA